MAAWFIPAIKAVLPHIGLILSAAVPVFTKKNADSEASHTLMQEQISELQSAASQNATHVKELAAQLQSMVTALEQLATSTALRRRRLLMLCVAALIMSACSLFLSFYIISVR